MLTVKTATFGTHQVSRHGGREAVGGGKAHEDRAGILVGAKVGAERKKRHIACDCVLSSSPYETLRHVLWSWLEAAPNAGFLIGA